MQDAIDIKVLQTLNPDRKRHCFRSAGACPPRTFDPTEKRRGERSAGACPPRSLRRNKKRPQPKRPRTFPVNTGARRGTGPRPTVNGDGFLLPNHHLPRCGELTGFERIEIDPTCNGFSLCIAAVPIRCAGTVLIDARRDLTEFQGAD